MRATVRNLILVLLSSLGVALNVLSAGAQSSISGRQDISELYSQAEESFDLSREDAIMLFDSQRIHWLPDGRLVRHIHRIVWINTNIAIRNYGDHRIPYDDAHCTFHVITVRTWRDGQWWETGATGIVETLPFELDKACNYTNLREMMLLHNGIELPCILELAYFIEDKEPFRRGAEGLWTFARGEPAVQSWFAYGLPAGQRPNVFASPDVPEPEKSTDKKLGLDTYLWKMGPLDAIPRPHTDDPAADVPHIVWSIWESWTDYGNYLNSSFQTAMRLDEPLKRALDSLLVEARTETEKADLVAKFINEKTRLISYPEHYWWSSPRPPIQTYSTAYGHRLDRAILAAAMFKGAGIETHPVFLGKGYGPIDEGVPTLSRMTGIGVWISGENLEAYYDPASGVVSNGFIPICGRTLWLPGSADIPEARLNSKNQSSLIDVRLVLSFDEEKGDFTGTGYFYADNCFNPYDRMEGLAQETETYLGSVVSSLIKGAKVTGFNPSNFDRFRVIVGFQLELKSPAPDDLGRLRLVIGEPSSGILGRLPDDLRLFHRSRSSSLHLPCLMHQKVELRLGLKGMDLIYHPTNQEFENNAGSISVTTDQRDNRIIITRELKLTKTIYPPEEWGALRALLLAETHERSQTLLLKPTGSSDKD